MILLGAITAGLLFAAGVTAVAWGLRPPLARLDRQVDAVLAGRAAVTDSPWRRWRGFESVERCREAARLLFPLTHVPSRLWYRILASAYLDFADEYAIAFAARNAAAESMRGPRLPKMS